MGVQLSIWLMVIMFSILSGLQLFGQAETLVPCYFIFGDSLIDNGNNNDLISFAKTNYYPYGIDYPSGPTGRFTNGRTFVDFIAEYLGFKEHIPPNAFTSGKAILEGLNYASGGGGIRSESGKVVGGRLGFDRQLQNHGRSVSSILTLLGENATTHLNRCLYTVQMGSNDYLNNYLLPILFDTSRQYNPTEYATILIHQYSQQLTTLYNYGARKIALFGLGPLGCIPRNIKAAFGSFNCSEEANNDARLFDTMLLKLVDSLNHDLSDAKFVFVNVSHLFKTIPPDSGITNKKSSCCVTDFVTGLCKPHSIPCSDRSTHAFWDAYHPSERLTQLEAERAYKAITPLDVYPYDISTLVQLQL